jgi:Flp pilus assembly pilin Flp
MRARAFRRARSLNPRPIERGAGGAFGATRRQQRGATAVEYALVLTFIAGALVGAVGALGGIVLGLFREGSIGWP